MPHISSHNILSDLGSITNHIIEKTFGSNQFKVIVAGHNDLILVRGCHMICISGTLVTRQFEFENEIISCFYTTFKKNHESKYALHENKIYQDKVLVVVFIDQIRIYNNKGGSKILAVPFHIKRAFPFQDGIVINKAYDMTMPSFDSLSAPSGSLLSSIQTAKSSSALSSSTPTSSIPSVVSAPIGNSFLSESNFLTLTDPLGDPGMISSSSVTSFSSREELTSFPESSKYSLATLFNPLERKLNVYHVRYLSNSKSHRNKKNTYLGLRKSSVRNTSSSSALQPVTPNTSRTLEGEQRLVRLSSVLSYDRMASGGEINADSSSTAFAGNPSFFQKLRKTVIFTKLNHFSLKGAVDKIKVFNIIFKDQEAIVISNLNKGRTTFLIYDSPPNIVSLPNFNTKFSVNSTDIVKAQGLQYHPGYVLLKRDNNKLFLFNPFIKLSSPEMDLSNLPEITTLDGFSGSTLILGTNALNKLVINLSIEPADKVTGTLLKSFQYLTNSYLQEYFWLQWCGSRSAQALSGTDWVYFVITLLSMTSLSENVKLDDKAIQKNEITRLLPAASLLRAQRSTNDLDQFDRNYNLDSLLPIIVLSLHIIREDLRLDVLAYDKLKRLAVFLAQLVSWMGWSEKWFRYYHIDPVSIDRSTRKLLSQPIEEPPNIFCSLSSLFTDKIVPYITFAQLAEDDEEIDRIIIPRTYYLLRLFEILISPQFTPEDVIRMMVDYNIKNSDIETLPVGLYVILKNKVMYCRESIRSQCDLNQQELALIGRRDLLESENSCMESVLSAQISSYNLKSEGAKDMPEIIKYVNNSTVLSPWDDQAEADRFHVTRLIFSDDRRFYEVTRLLQSSKVQTGFLKLPSTMDENKKLTKQRALGAKLAIRTLTIPVGRAALFISSRKPLVTEKFPIPKMNFSALILPAMINIGLEKGSIDSYLYDWGYFHNGVSAGLMISRNFDNISGSWIVFNRPPTLNAQHAGFLLGLGLNGHLKHLEEWHIYNYLGPKHNFTSMGLLLGMAASLKGTMDVKLTKVLSVHVVALLPPGSTDLNVQLPVQTAGIIGIGLLYAGSQHRRMTEMLLSQLTSILTINERKTVNEGYRLAAGIALGYINIGKGGYLKDSSDASVLNSLLYLATLVRDIESTEELDKSCGGALLALTFMFLRTENRNVAEKLDIPKTRQLIDYLRPDLLMLRCLAKNMIMWESIGQTTDWIEDQIPSCVSEMFDLDHIDYLDSESLPYLNIIGGELLSMAIRFASTGSVTVKQTMLEYLDRLITLCSRVPANFDQRIALIGARNVRDVVVLGLSILMSGSGDLDTLRRLRYLQGMTDQYTNYGDFMAINTALGFLFLGGGQQAFRTDDSFSIVSLITSIYPVYSTNNYECTTECTEILLEALRHFWALSVENRCLVVRNVGDKQPIKVGVNVNMNDGSKLHLFSPCLLPELGKIQKVVICPRDSNLLKEKESCKTSSDGKYFPVEFDFMNAAKSQSDKFKKNLTVFVYKRPQYQNLNLTFNYMLHLEKNKDTNNSYSNKDKLDYLNCFQNLNIIKKSKEYEKNLLLSSSVSAEALIESSVMDVKLEVEHLLNSNSIDKLWNLKLLFNYVDKIIFDYKDEQTHSSIRKSSGTYGRIPGNSLPKPKSVWNDTLLNNSVDPNNTARSYDDTFESHNDRAEAGDYHENNMSYLSIKFIEEIRNKLFKKVKMNT